MILKTIMLPSMVFILHAPQLCLTLSAEVKTLLGCLLIARVGFAANDALTAFKLIERGFKKEWFALFALIEFPIGILLALVIAKYVSRQNALSGVRSRFTLCTQVLTARKWMMGYGLRIFFSILGPLLVYLHPVGQVGNVFFFVVLVCMLLISFGSNVRMIAISSEHIRFSLFRSGNVRLPRRILCANF